MYASGRTIDEVGALKVLKVAAEGLLYLSRNNIPHAALQPGDIYLGMDNHPRLANLAAQTGDQQLSVEQEIEVLGQGRLAGAAPTRFTRHAGSRCADAADRPPAPSPAWGALLQGIKALEPKIVPVEAEKISAQERAASAAAEKARKAQKRAFFLNLASMVSRQSSRCWAVWFYVLRSNERRRSISKFTFPPVILSSAKVKPRRFRNSGSTNMRWTIRSVRQVCRVDQREPGRRTPTIIEKQPKQFGHIPHDWEIYYQNARAGKAAHSTPIDLNCPMLTVTWWDAYAYAKWKGRQLPTEQEWERAARGTDGRAYPWGDDPDMKKANTGADFQPKNPGAFGSIDGFNFWGPVDKEKYDKSPDGVMGMAGNVSEWIGSWNPENTKPIIKGGNFTIPLRKLSEQELAEPGRQAEFIGFRTVTHKPPETQ